MAADQPDDRHLGLRIGAEQRGEIGMVQHRQRLAADLVLLRRVQAVHRQGEKAPRRRSRSSAASSGRLCNSRCTRSPRLKRSRPALASGDSAAGSAPLGRDGSSGLGGSGSAGGGWPSHAGTAPADRRGEGAGVAHRRRGLRRCRAAGLRLTSRPARRSAPLRRTRTASPSSLQPAWHSVCQHSAPLAARVSQPQT